MANEKLIKQARADGFCCMWAFLEANKATNTSELVKMARASGITITARAIRHQRRAYRRGLIKCEEKPACLKKVIGLPQVPVSQVLARKTSD